MLTDIACRQAKPKDKAYKLADSRGLYLFVQPNGGKYWRYKYRFAGKEKVLALGIYNDVSLLEARERHLQAYKQVKEGVDPSLEKRQKKNQLFIEHNNTFEIVGREWLKKRSDEVKVNTLKDITNRIEKELFPKIGTMPLKAISPMIMLETLRVVESRGVYETTKRVRQYASQIFQYAIATGRAETDPTQPIIGALKTKKVEHQKAMNLDDLSVFLHKLETNEIRLYRQTVLALKLMLLTFTRKKELTEATWDEISFKNNLWTIPAGRMKMGKPHLVPLSKQVIEILQELKTLNGHYKHIFPSQIEPRKPMNEDTPLRALYSLGFKGIHTIHGFRALAMTTILENLGYSPDVVDAQLAHAKRGSLGGAYDRAQYLKERIKMMEDWSQFILDLEKH